ncbi:hypothetical protein BKA64DRAFT_700805 [Cadophora sp. MPI-SDFR-AT-0126]|nr:hypothetical protein BKA64DRAFT_700805 [Leotiomycetes sp. MPI-SDFR-AT-0126]
MMAAAATGLGATSSIPRFPQFRRLPLELRLIIWEDSARVPRVVELNSCQKRSKLSSRTSVPAMLHVNKEARQVGSKYYEKISPYTLDRNICFTFIRWEVDIVLFHEV